MDTVFAFLSALTAVISAAVAWYAVYRANEQTRDQLRPIIVFDEVRLDLSRAGRSPSEERAGIIFKNLRNDGTGLATNIVIVVASKRWKQPEEKCAGYWPHGRDYMCEEFPFPLTGVNVVLLTAREQADEGPDISFYYSDIFGRRFMTRYSWKLAVTGVIAGRTHLRLHFSQVEKDDHLNLPGEDANARVITPEPKNCD